MSLVVPKYRALLDDSESVLDPLAHGLMKLVEPQVSVTWDLIPFRQPINQLTYERGDRSISAREVVTAADITTSDTQITLTAATAKRVTSGHILYDKTTGERFVLESVNTSTGVCQIRARDLFSDPSGAKALISSGATLIVLGQTERFEEINAESRVETTTKVTNYIQDVTELLEWSVADLREGRKWGVDKQTRLRERMRDIMKDMNNSIVYNVPVAADGTKSAVTAGFDYMIEQAGSVVDAAASGTANLADVRGVLKVLQKNGVGPADGVVAVMSVNAFHEYQDKGLEPITLNGEPGSEFVIGNTIRGINVSGLGFVPFYSDPHIDDDRVRFIATGHAGKSYYQGTGEGALLEAPRVIDEPSMSTSKVQKSSFQLKWGTVFDNASSVHYILDNTGLN